MYSLQVIAQETSKERSRIRDRRNRKRQKSKSPQNKRKPPPQNADDFTNLEEEPPIDDFAVLLNWCKTHKYMLFDTNSRRSIYAEWSSNKLTRKFLPRKNIWFLYYSKDFVS